MTAHIWRTTSGPAQSAMEAVEDLYRAHAPGLARFALVLLGDKIAADLPETAGRELDEIPA